MTPSPNGRPDVLRVARQPIISELLYDADCPLCAAWAERCRRGRHKDFVLKPLQEAAANYPEIADCLPQAIHLVEPDGRVSRGVEALLRARFLGGGARWPLWLYEHSALSRWAMNTVYRIVVAHRPRRRT